MERASPGNELRLKRVMRGRLLLRLLGILTFIAGAVGLWYGFAMSFLVPERPGEPYFQRDRVLLGNLPLLGSVLALSAAGWLLFRSLSEPKITLERAITYCIGGAVALGFLYAVIGALITHPTQLIGKAAKWPICYRKLALPRPNSRRTSATSAIHRGSFAHETSL